jgi:uncharacterized protein YndB with AHSA1/START domain
MKWVLIGLAVVAAVGLILAAIGWSLPAAHTARRQQTLAAPPDDVWRVITDVDAFPSWRTEVRRVERLSDRDGRMVWVEEGSSGRLTLAVERSEPPRLLVLRIADPGLPFGGAWTYEIAPADRGSLLTITENGEVYNPIFRFMSRFIFGHEATIAAYMSAIERRLGAAPPASSATAGHAAAH